jgi:hypothetical protein
MKLKKRKLLIFKTRSFLFYQLAFTFFSVYQSREQADDKHEFIFN